MASALTLCTATPLLCVLSADAFAQPSQTGLRPGEFHAENREPDRNDHDGRAGCHYHYDTDSKDSTAGGQYCDSSCHSIGDSGCFLHPALSENRNRVSKRIT